MFLAKAVGASISHQLCGAINTSDVVRLTEELF